jgi:3-phosphoshikimate 1-carboxyvinyltransferase
MTGAGRARRVRVPGDKSLSHRALMFSALAEGTSELRNVQAGEDVRATARVLRALGCAVPQPTDDGGAIRVEGRGVRSLVAPPDVLECANSGTTARLMLGILAGQTFRSVLTGDASLQSRPMGRVMRPLAAMGVRFQELARPERLPLAIEGGALSGLEYTSPIASAQVKSAILLAGLSGEVDVSVREPVLSRDHTERMLASMGVPVSTDTHADGSVTVRLRHAGALRPISFDVPGDFSAAAYFLGFALLAGCGIIVEHVGLNPTRTGLLRVLERMGARVTQENVRVEAGEPVGDVRAEPSSLEGTSVSAAEIPSLLDEVPVLAVIAARAAGETTVRGAGELRVKESDRIAALVSNLRALGVAVEELTDGLVVRGADRPLRGHVQTYGDHRIAMAFGVLGAVPDNDITVDDTNVAAVSFPSFWRQLDALTGR